MPYRGSAAQRHEGRVFPALVVVPIREIRRANEVSASARAEGCRMLRSCRPTLRALSAVLALALLAACAGRISNGKSGLCDNAGYLAARKIAHVRTEVTICGTVARIRTARRTQSGLHLWFYVRVAPHVNARVIADESVLGPLLVRVGDKVEVQGRFFRDRDGFDGIDWTHRVSGTHSSWSTPGFVVINGIEYR